MSLRKRIEELEAVEGPLNRVNSIYCQQSSFINGTEVGEASSEIRSTQNQTGQEVTRCDHTYILAP